MINNFYFVAFIICLSEVFTIKRMRERNSLSTHLKQFIIFIHTHASVTRFASHHPVWWQVMLSVFRILSCFRHDRGFFIYKFFTFSRFILHNNKEMLWINEFLSFVHNLVFWMTTTFWKMDFYPWGERIARHLLGFAQYKERIAITG
jgi:hypothetical protein